MKKADGDEFTFATPMHRSQLGIAAPRSARLAVRCDALPRSEVCFA